MSIYYDVDRKFKKIYYKPIVYLPGYIEIAH